MGRYYREKVGGSGQEIVSGNDLDVRCATEGRLVMVAKRGPGLLWGTSSDKALWSGLGGRFCPEVIYREA